MPHPPPAPPAPTLADRRVRVETPEHVAVGYELADLGSRFAALLIDGLILLSGAVAIPLGIVLLGVLIGRAGLLADWLASLGGAVIVLLGFAWFWGYFVLLEGLRDGQTPGKRWMGIRAVHDGGYPLTLRGAAVRNLVRIVDMQPGASWLVGGAAMMLHPLTKRLGDMAAGSIVVRERSGVSLPEEAASRSEALGPPRLPEEEFAWLSRYVLRRRELNPDVRARLARERLARWGDRFADDPRLRQMTADEFLARLHDEEAARRASAGSAGGSAQAAALLRRQRERWDRYRDTLERARRRGLRSLPEGEVSRFAALYREVAADLARARTYGASPELVYTLERSVGAGHNLLYRPGRRSLGFLLRWLARGFPAQVRRRWAPIALAAALLYGPAAATYVAVRAQPEVAREILSPFHIGLAEEAAAKEARGEGYVEVEVLESPLMSSQLIANNVQVTFLAFAGGVLAGLGTVWVLITNGMLLGGVAGLFDHYGAGLNLWTFVLPHGVVELTAICVAGGAGLWMGSALVLPGRLTRARALAERARDAVSLIAGSAMLLVVAGIIEGFVSPSPVIPRPAKLAFAAGVAALLVVYLFGAGRGAEEDAAEDAA